MQKKAEICRLLRENGNDIAVFDTHSLGLYTGRDPYAYNFSKDELRKHMLREKQTYKEEKVYPAFYRTFVPMWVYFDEVFNSSISRLPSIFPTSDAENLAIVVSGKGSDWFDAFITDRIVDYGFMYNTQIFPLYIYTETFQKQYNISDNALRLFREELDNTTITKEDIFFYVFGLLSTPFCVKRFRNSLSKELPTVPILRRFREISKCGRLLAGVQLIYQQYVWAVVMKEEKEELPEYSDLTVVADENALKEYVQKIRLDKENREITINGKVKVQDIPEFAFKCKVGNYPPIEWVSRYLVRQEDKETGVVWDSKLRVAEFVDIVKKLVAFSGMCLKIKQGLEELYFTSDKIREEEKILNEVFNLDFHEFVDEYTDKGSCIDSEHLPDFYLLSKEEGLPNLAIEVKTLRRDHDRPADYETPPEVEEHHLAVKDFHFVLKLDLLAYKNPPPKKVRGVWYSLKEELDKYKEKWEYVLDRLSDIEKLLENEDEDIYVKDLPHEKKSELRKIIDDIKRQDERFVKSLPIHILFAYTCLATHPEICQIKIKDVKGKIKKIKEKGLSIRVADFIWYHFIDELKDSPKNYIMRVKEEGVKDGSIFITTRFIITMEREDPAFHIKEIERYVKESKGKFDNLRKVKSDKSDDSPHWELLLVKGLLVADRDFNSLIEEIEAELTKKGYDYLLLVREQKGGEDNEFITFEIKCGIVRILDGGWEGDYYLIIRMDGGTGSSVEDDWKTQIRKIIKLKIHEKPDYSIANALDNPEKFAEEVDKLIEAYPSYLGRLIRDLRASLMQCTSEKALKLIKEIVKKSNKKDILLEIAKLLRDTFEENLIPVDYKDELWEVIDGILNKLDKLEIGNRIPLKDICCHDVYGSIIFNNLEGSAIACLILYPYLLKKNDKIKDLNSIPEVKGRLEYYLNKQTSIIIHAVYGFYLHALLKIDEHWTKDMIPKIFPKDRVEHFWGAWCAYVQATYLYDEAYSLLKKDIYAHAIENMKYLECVKYMEDMDYLKCYEALIHHLADLYGRGIISLDDDIFRKFWEKANDDVRKEFISYIGQEILVAEIRGDVIERFKELWEWRISYIKDLSNRQDFQKELKSFIHWFVSKRFDDKWALENLIKTVELVDEITEEHVYSALDVLVGMANKFPELVLRYLDLLTHKASESILKYKITIKDRIEEISEILESKGRSDLEKELKEIKEAIN